MNNETCKTIRLLLVDYSDGLLPTEQVQQTEAHLAECPACREELHLLERSLELAREVWNESGTVPIFVPTKMGLSLLPHLSSKTKTGLSHLPRPQGLSRFSSQRKWDCPFHPAWIAGSLAVCASVIFILIAHSFFSQTNSADVAKRDALTQSNSIQSTSTNPNEEIDVMEYIAREDRSARLAASVDILAAEPGLEVYKENAERYLKQTYPDTVAVQMLSKQ